MASETPVGVVNGVNAVFTASADLVADHMLFVDRVLQIHATDYTYAGRVITFEAGSIPQLGSTVRLYNGVSVALSASGVAWATASELISDAALELGLVSAAIANPFTSTDPNILQLCAFLKSQGRELAKLRRWTHLQKEHTFNTVAATATYALPADFREMVDQSGWNRTSRLPLGGPLSPTQWQYIQAAGVGVINVMFRPKGGNLTLTPTPTGVSTIALEYLSRYWVQPSGQSSPTSETPSAGTDTIAFEPLLVVRALKLAFLSAKGFDATAAQDDYLATLEQAMSDDSPSTSLSLSPGGGEPLLSELNLPDTGYGS